jgi:hypothetical protein
MVMEENKIVLFGATGYTGELVARSLVDAGSYPILVGRSEEKLAPLADDLGGLDVVVADAEEPDGTVRDLLDPGDVLVTTVGPFVRYGEPAVNAAVNAGAHYIDSTGEPPFIRTVFDEFGPRAEGSSVLLPAFGYDYVPGHLAAGLVLEKAGDEAVRVDVGYFASGESDTRPQPSRGTAASVVGIAFGAGFAWRDGILQTVRNAERVGSFEVDGRRLDGISVGGSEHLSLPRLWPQLREVNVYLGWFGPMSAALSRGSVIPYALGRVPGMRKIAQAAADVVADRIGATSADESAGLRDSRFVAVAYDMHDQLVAEVELRGPDAYRFTGDIMAWGARRAASVGVETTGAAGPIEAFGLESLQAGCAEAGLVVV